MNYAEMNGKLAEKDGKIYRLATRYIAGADVWIILYIPIKEKI